MWDSSTNVGHDVTVSPIGGIQGMALISGVTSQPTSPTHASHRGVARLPVGIWFPIAVFASMRLLDVVFIVIASRHQISLAPVNSSHYYIHTPSQADPGYWSVITNWDGQWYERIATQGYPVPDQSGGLAASWSAYAFNFLPLFPLMAGLLMSVTGLGFAAAASIVSISCGAAAMVVLFKIIERTAGKFAACSVVALVSAFISAPVLQIAYKESTVLLLLLLWFWWVQQRRYWWAAVAVLALCFAKYLTPPMALVLAAHALNRWRHRSTDPIRRRDWLGMATIGGVSAAGLYAWRTLVKFWLGNASDRVYNRASQVTNGTFGAFSQFYRSGGLAGLTFLVLVVVVLMLYSRTAHASSWGTEIQTWLWAYPAFLLMGAPIMPATLRYLIPAFPLALMVVGSPKAPGTIPRRKLWLVIGFCILGLALQWWWIDSLLIVRQLADTPMVP